MQYPLSRLFQPAERSFCKSEYFADAFDYAVDFLSGGSASEAETDGTFPDVICHAHRFQHRRQLHSSGMTR